MEFYNSALAIVLNHMRNKGRLIVQTAF